MSLPAKSDTSEKPRSPTLHGRKVSSEEPHLGASASSVQLLLPHPDVEADGEEAPAQRIVKPYKKGRRHVIFESSSSAADDGGELPVIEKSDDAKQKILDCTHKNFLFSRMDQSQKEIVVRLSRHPTTVDFLYFIMYHYRCDPYL
jgi:hypothetical protein